MKKEVLEQKRLWAERVRASIGAGPIKIDSISNVSTLDAPSS